MAETGENPVRPTKIEDRVEKEKVLSLDPIDRIVDGKNKFGLIPQDFIQALRQSKKDGKLDYLSRPFQQLKPVLIGLGLWFLEVARETGLGGDGYSGLVSDQKPVPWIQNLPGVEHMGNLGESYVATALAYYGISLVTKPLKEKIPEKLKVAVAFLAGSVFFTATELGLIRAGTPDVADIPAGIAGPLIFSGVMLLNKRFIKDCGRAIKDLSHQIKGKSHKQ